MLLKHRLLVLALIAVLPAVALWTATELAWRGARRAEVGVLALAHAQNAASEMQRIVESVRNLLTAVAEVPSIQALDTPSCVDYLARLQPKVPHLLSIAAFDLDGRMRCRQETPSPDLTFADRSYFREAVATGGFVVGEFTQARVLGRPVLPFAVPIEAFDGRVQGVLAAALDLDWLNAVLRERALSKGGSLTIADREGVIIARDPLPERFVGTRIPDEFQHLVRGQAPGSLEVLSQDGTRRILGYIPAGLPPVGLYISSGFSVEQVFAKAERISRRGLALVAVGLAMALAAAWFAGRQFIERPVGRLLSVVAAWQSGDLTARTGLGGHVGEFGALGTALDHMADEVSRRQTQIGESEARFRQIAETVEAVFWIAEPEDHRLIYVSPAYEKIWKRPLDELHRDPLSWTLSIHPDDRDRVRGLYREAALQGGYDTEFRIVQPDGTERWIHDRGFPLRQPDGTVRRVVGAAQDVTERKAAEKRQKLLLNELNHRVKNTLATVQSIAVQTMQSEQDPKAALDRFQSRLMALSDTHNLLNQSGWTGAPLEAILERAVAPFGGAEGERVRIDGEPVEMDAKSALAIGLVAHELATNAAKYGALSAAGGRLEISWRRLPGGDCGALLCLDWTERGGPPVSPPARRGFGSRLIKRSIEGELGGTVRVDYRRAGLHCVMEIPLTARIETSEPAPRRDSSRVEA